MSNSANQALHQLESEGLLRVEFGGVTVLDLPGLRGYSPLKVQSTGRPGHCAVPEKHTNSNVRITSLTRYGATPQ